MCDLHVQYYHVCQAPEFKWKKTLSAVFGPTSYMYSPTFYILKSYLTSLQNIVILIGLNFNNTNLT